MSLLQKYLRVLLALVVVIKVATAGESFELHGNVHSGHHENVAEHAVSPQDKYHDHCALDLANASSSHCGVSIYALIDSSRALFYASMGVDVVPFVDQAWSTLNFPPRLRPPMRLA